jgi:hypothetical protein
MVIRSADIFTIPHVRGDIVTDRKITTSFLLILHDIEVVSYETTSSIWSDGSNLRYSFI